MAKDQRSSGHRTVNKSAETGRFVSDKAVKKNPKTTYQQTVKKGK
ncbi:MAG TPA: hypothetical protein PK018_05835 [Candidatus Competibacter sp.]|jgi:hypothetical protein|nr:hypothetical protein [Candidatus Competibacter sp.]HRX71736.1 hypothetical protein [Candidatus Competibacteraceae bacterium]